MKVEIGGLFEIDTKSVTEEGAFEGYASVFGRTDLVMDVVRPGAFTKSLMATPAAKVKMLRGHDTSEPIGVWTALSEDSTGLHAKGKLVMDVARARETYALMRAGALDGLSIGFKSKRNSYDRTKGLRYLDEIDLKEISVVTFPAMPDALVTGIKAAANDHDLARHVVSALNRATAALRTP